MPYKDPKKQREAQRRWVAKRKAEYLKDKTCEMCANKEDLNLVRRNKQDKRTRPWSVKKEHRAAIIKKLIVLCRPCANMHRKDTYYDVPIT